MIRHIFTTFLTIAILCMLTGCKTGVGFDALTKPQTALQYAQCYKGLDTTDTRYNISFDKTCVDIVSGETVSEENLLAYYLDTFNKGVSGSFEFVVGTPHAVTVGITSFDTFIYDISAWGFEVGTETATQQINYAYFKIYDFERKTPYIADSTVRIDGMIAKSEVVALDSTRYAFEIIVWKER